MRSAPSAASASNSVGDEAGGPGDGLDRPSVVDRAMTSRARRRLAVQTAAAVTSAVLLVGGAAWLLVGHEQRRDVDRRRRRPRIVPMT